MTESMKESWVISQECWKLQGTGYGAELSRLKQPSFEFWMDLLLDPMSLRTIETILNGYETGGERWGEPPMRGSIMLDCSINHLRRATEC